MTSELEHILDKQLAIEARIEQAQANLQDLEAELRSVDAELEALGDRREQFEVLGQICTSLDRLEELGSSELFWGNRIEQDIPARHLTNIRERMADFRAQFDKVGGRREGIVHDIQELDELLACLDDALLYLKDAEEYRRSEWMLEREPEEGPFRKLVMPWARGFEEDQRFRKSLLSTAVASALLAFLLSIIELPIPDRNELLELPERVANLIRQEPPPPPPAVVEEQMPEPEPPEQKPAEYKVFFV